MLKVTNIKVSKIEAKEESRLRGTVSIVIDNCLAVHDIKIIQGKNRMFVAMPSRKGSEGSFMDIIHPINQETRQQLESAILAEFNK